MAQLMQSGMAVNSAAQGGGGLLSLLFNKPQTPANPLPGASSGAPAETTAPSETQDYLSLLMGKRPSETGLKNNQFLKLLNFGANGF